jgi:hypothetical protein
MADTYRLVLRKNSSTGKVLGTKGPYSSQAKAIAAAESLRKKVGKGDFISVEKQRVNGVRKNTHGVMIPAALPSAPDHYDIAIEAIKLLEAAPPRGRPLRGGTYPVAYIVEEPVEEEEDPTVTLIETVTDLPEKLDAVVAWVGSLKVWIFDPLDPTARMGTTKFPRGSSLHQRAKIVADLMRDTAEGVFGGDAAAIARHEEEAYGRAERSHKGNPNGHIPPGALKQYDYVTIEGGVLAGSLGYLMEHPKDFDAMVMIVKPSVGALSHGISKGMTVEVKPIWLSPTAHGEWRNNPDQRPSNVPPERWQRWIDEEEALRAKYPKTKQAFIDEYVRVTGEFYRAQHKSKKWHHLNKVLGEMWDAQNRWAPEGELRGDIEEAKYRLEKAARQWDNAAEIKQLKERLRHLESELRELEKRGGVPRLRNNPMDEETARRIGWVDYGTEKARRYRRAYMEKENEPWTDPDFPWAMLVYDPSPSGGAGLVSVIWHYASEDTAAQDLAGVKRMIDFDLPTLEIQKYVRDTLRNNPSEAECDARVRRALEGKRKKHRKAPTWTSPEDFPPLPTGARINPMSQRKRVWVFERALHSGFQARNVKTGAKVYGDNLATFRVREWRKSHGLPDYIGKEAEYFGARFRYNPRGSK